MTPAERLPSRAPAHLQIRRWLLAAFAIALLGACGQRWQPAHPPTLRLGSPQLAIDATRATLQANGYRVTIDEPSRAMIVARAKLDQPKDSREQGKRTSYLTFQAYSDGSLRITATGEHVKPDEHRLHHRLAAEIEQLATEIRHTANRLYEARLRAATAPPPPYPSAR